MREKIIDNRPADLRGVDTDTNASEREYRAEYNRQSNGNQSDSLYDGFTIHETFDPKGPEFVDCVVRIFE